MSSRGKDWTSAAWSTASIGAILAVFVLVRLPLLTKEAAFRGWNGDSAIFGLMAKKIHDGKGFDVFFWGQNYQGPLTPALAAVIRRAILDPAGVGAEGGPISLRLASMSELAFGICLFVQGLTRLFGRVIATAAGLWLAIGPPHLIRLSAVHGSELGPEMAFALASVLFFLATGALTRPRPFLDRPVGHFLFGLLAGIGWWMNQTIVFVLVPVASLVLFRCWRNGARFIVLVLAGFVVGYAPVWMGRLAGWYEPSLGPVVPVWRRSGSLARLVQFFGTDSWRIVGLEGLVPPLFLAAVAFAFVTLLVVVYVRREKLPLRTEEPRLEGLDLVVAIVALGTAVFLLKDITSSQLRFLTPALPAALVLLIVIFAETVSRLRRRIPAWFLALASSGLALFLVVFLARQARAVVAGILSEPDLRAPLGKIAEGGYTVCHGGYDTAYVLQFLSDERVRFIPYHSPDRNRTLSARLRSMPGPQCLVTDDGVVREWLPSDAAREGGPTRLRQLQR